MVKVLSAEFETSAADATGWPEEGPPEVAFVGRSNVGKSSLLNSLVARKGLARTSADPGRTRLVNFFAVETMDDEGARYAMRFVDLPGFGYAKVSRSERSSWRPAIERYLSARQPLRVVALLVDPRRVPDAGEADEDALLDERELYKWLSGRGLAVVVVMTKADKLAKHERALVAERLRKHMGSGPLVLYSSLSGDGRDKLWQRLHAGVTREKLTPSDGNA